jgi:hypothetical protein
METDAIRVAIDFLGLFLGSLVLSISVAHAWLVRVLNKVAAESHVTYERGWRDLIPVIGPVRALKRLWDDLAGPKALAVR